MDQDAFASAIRNRMLSADLAAQWAEPRRTPTRYAVIDDLLPVSMANEIASAFPTDNTHFAMRDSFRERKRTSTRFDQLPSILKSITFAFQEAETASAIATDLELPDMTGDPTLYAGGLSIMRRGDFLNPHIDNSHEASRSRYRRVNLLYYATPGWRLENGGNLELWDDRVSRPVTIPSLFNRLVIMETNRNSWHSVSPVVVDKPRCCVSNYYFSPLSPDGSDYFHITSFSARPEQKVRRVVAQVDAVARTIAGRLGMGRGKHQRYAPIEYKG